MDTVAGLGGDGRTGRGGHAPRTDRGSSPRGPGREPAAAAARARVGRMEANLIIGTYGLQAFRVMLEHGCNFYMGSWARRAVTRGHSAAHGSGSAAPSGLETTSAPTKQGLMPMQGLVSGVSLSVCAIFARRGREARKSGGRLQRRVSRSIRGRGRRIRIGEPQQSTADRPDFLLEVRAGAAGWNGLTRPGQGPPKSGCGTG